ncbi:putative MFS family arabinose efflux permease [Humibacillus xanthopallidus]|uniref:Putative MFS family arabinose efflux permease n=1 Tax=Humibacillus xanthopallidus TaxID=412689 RepID=A0A543PLN0_9MICO|nr:MFS transporter [Humibacillus xanthopallidus]TQN44982.1 putative MFS family arabinose efflux permease [Humibacillus xanthopallidus]
MPEPTEALDLDPAHRKGLQRNVIRTLITSQILSGLGMASGLAVGALLAEDLSGTESLAGLGTTFQVLGGALIAIPVARVMAARGRRPGLQLGLALALVGAALVVTAAVARSFPLLLVGMLLFGGGTSANSQSRYAAADLALPQHRGRDLSVVVWATTIGSVLGPNLVGPGQAFARALGLPELAGSFVFSLAGFALALVVITRLLRPDPLLTARALERADRAASAGRHTEPARSVVTTPRTHAAENGAALEPVDGVGPGELGDGNEDHDGSLTRGLRVVRSNGRARLGVLTIALGHVVMVSVMVMTPIHMSHGHADLQVIGFVISVHILGMFAFSPIIGAAVDRWGGPIIAATGGAVLTLASVLASQSMTGWSPLLLIALLLLGVGWSCTLISGSTMLTSAVTAEERPATQGLSEVFMGLAGAGGGLLAGVVVDRLGYGTLAMGAAVVGVAVVVMVAVTAPRRPTTS